MNSTQKPVAIVTGASSGIGLGITLALIKHGYDVVGTSRIISNSKELKASPDLVLIDGDISKKETTVQVAEAAIEHFGRIDLLVNNAGIFNRQAVHRVHRGRLQLSYEHQCGEFLLHDAASDPADEEAKFGTGSEHLGGPGGPTEPQRARSFGRAFEGDHARSE